MEAYLPGSALDIQNRVQIAPVGTGPLNPGNANDERGFLGLAFHPGFNNDAKSRLPHAVHLHQRNRWATGATYAGPKRRGSKL